MSAMTLDKSLDDIIAARPKARRGSSRRTSAKAHLVGSSATGAAPAARVRQAAAPPAAQAAAATPQSSDKIIVSNLPNDVNEAQIRELFQSTVGTLRDVTLHFDSAGRSKGTASVTFIKKTDGAKAYAQYNNRLIDGKRPMRIEMVLDPSRAPPATLASRVAPAPTQAAPAVEGASRGKPAKRGGRPRGRGGKKPSERTPKTAADLDAEMEDYSSNPPAAAAA